MNTVMYSNKGVVREHNEDAVFAAGNVASNSNMSSPVELNVEASEGCFVVIDDMGGYEGGEKAARLVALSFLEKAEGWDIPMEKGREKISRILHGAVKYIAAAIADNPVLHSMGAALAGIAVCSDGVLAFNCGDCRVYRQRNEYLERLSHDHSIVQELCDYGKIDEEAMRTHPRKNATSLNTVMSSGRLKNREKRVFARNPVPSGASSRAVVEKSPLSRLKNFVLILSS